MPIRLLLTTGALVNVALAYPAHDAGFDQMLQRALTDAEALVWTDMGAVEVVVDLAAFFAREYHS